MEVKIMKDDSEELTFELTGADYSLPQLLVEKLNADKSVQFAACKVAHPLVGNPVVTVRTKKEKPMAVVIRALKEMTGDISDFRKKFSDIVG
jgi:DNA-directed RNA polymerase subunit L